MARGLHELSGVLKRHFKSSQGHFRRAISRQYQVVAEKLKSISGDCRDASVGFRGFQPFEYISFGRMSFSERHLLECRLAE